MGKFEETVVKAKDIFDDSTKKIGEVIGVQKQKIKLASLNSDLSKTYETLGRILCDACAESMPEDAKPTVEEINRLKADIADMEVKLAESQGKKICSGCGFMNAPGIVFCGKCGKKLDD